MGTAFQIIRQLIGDIFHLPVHQLESEADIYEFSCTQMLHDSQGFLEPDSLISFLEELPPGKIYYITERFQVQYIFVRMEDIPVVFGPFCSLIWTEQDCLRYLHRMNITEVLPTDLLAYRSRFTVINDREVLHIVHSCTHLIDPAKETWDIIELDYCSQALSAQQAEAAAPLRTNYAELIKERYLTEQRLMRNVEKGDAHGAILALRALQQDVDFLKKRGTTLDNERVGAAIARTIIRIAGLNVGLSASTIDLLSQKNTVAVLNAATVEEIYREKENMIRIFCREIREHQNRQYSNLVLNAIHYIEHQYAQDLSIQQIADELNVNTNHLAAAFRKETGSTPGNYIRQTRVKQAARLLSSTDLSIQEISSMVGVPDANYFIKLFKKEYSLTPTQYRKYNRM